MSNQRQRWGSATYANTQIRISSELQGVPEYVLDSVIHHELCHLLPNHSAAFRALEARYRSCGRRPTWRGTRWGARGLEVSAAKQR